MIETIRIDDKIALVISGKPPYTVYRMTKWELVKLAFWSLFLCFTLIGCKPNQDPWQWGLDDNDGKLKFYAFCGKYDICSHRRSEIRYICKDRRWTITKDSMQEYAPDHYKSELECEKPK